VDSPKVVTLVTIADGAALELFQAAWDQVLKNVADPNTDAAVKREVTLKFSLKAVEDRDVGTVEVTCATKLAGIRGVDTLVYMGRDNGQLVAVEQPKQQDLFPSPGGRLVAVGAVPGGKE
jgi:hypothetical protein